MTKDEIVKFNTLVSKINDLKKQQNIIWDELNKNIEELQSLCDHKEIIKYLEKEIDEFSTWGPSKIFRYECKYCHKVIRK